MKILLLVVNILFYDSDMCPLMTKYFLGHCDHIFRPDEKEVYFIECK